MRNKNVISHFQKLTDKMDAQHIRGKKNDVSKIIYSYPKSGQVSIDATSLTEDIEMWMLILAYTYCSLIIIIWKAKLNFCIFSTTTVYFRYSIIDLLVVYLKDLILMPLSLLNSRPLHWRKKVLIIMKIIQTSQITTING